MQDKALKAEPDITFSLSMHLRTQLEPLGESVAFDKGSVIFMQGDECSGVHLLTAGAARISMLDDSGCSIACRNVVAGSVLGLPATLCHHTYMFTAETTSVCSFVFISAEQFQEFLRIHPEMCMEILQLMSKELAVANRKRSETSVCSHKDCNLRGTCSKWE